MKLARIRGYDCPADTKERHQGIRRGKRRRRGEKEVLKRSVAALKQAKEGGKKRAPVFVLEYETRREGGEKAVALNFANSWKGEWRARIES